MFINIKQEPSYQSYKSKRAPYTDTNVLFVPVGLDAMFDICQELHDFLL